MTIETTIAAIQGVNRAITGIRTAPIAYPGSLNTADLPMTIAWPDAAENMQEGMSYDFSQRVYRLVTYIMPTEQGQGINEGWQETIKLLQRFIDAWLDSDNVQLVTGTYSANIQQGRNQPQTDGGIQVIAYPPPALGIEGYPHYFGFEYRIYVNEKWTQT